MRVKITCCICVMLAVLLSDAQAATTEWKADSSGNWNGDWSDANHWTAGVPTSELDALLPQGNYAVTLTAAAEVKGLIVGKNEVTNAGVVTLAGIDQTLNVGGTYLDIKSNAVLMVSGPAVTAAQFVRVYGGAKLSVPSGRLVVVSSMYLNGGKLELSGGDVSVNVLELNDTADFEMTDGTFEQKTKCPQLNSAAAVFRLKGGTFYQRGTASTSKITDPRLLPQGGRYIVAYSGNSSVSLAADVNTMAVLGGSLCLTNGASAWFKLPQAMTLSGGGELYAGYLNFPSGTQTELRLSTLALGSQLYPGTSSYDGTHLGLIGPMTLAAFGDWTTGGRKCTIDLDGAIEIATEDCFDATKTHAIMFDNLSPKATASLAVTGGGSATCLLRDYWYHLDAMTLGAGTTLTLKDSFSCAVTVRDLMLGAGATVNVIPPVSLEVSRSMSVGAGAEISAALPAAPIAGVNYPVLLVHPGVTLPEITVTIANPSGDWRVERTPTGIWLTDDKVVAATQANEWTGAVGNGSWNTAGNWNGGVVPDAADEAVIIAGKNCADISADVVSGTLSVSNLTFKNCIPTVLSGSAIQFYTIGSGSESAFISKSDFPVVIENALVSKGRGSNLGVSSEGKSYICLAGTSTVSGKFFFDGDVRVNGSVTCGDLSHVAAQSGARASVLRVLNGGSLTVTGAYSENTKSSAIEVEGGATLTFQAAGKCRYYNNAFEHEINGRLDIEAPLFLGVVGTYDGTGRVDVATTKSYTRGSGSMRLKGGITVVPREWNTVTADSLGNAINLVIAGKATLGAACDWTYGVADGVTPTAAASARQLKLERPLAEVAFDTGDVVDETIGRTITIKEPIVGPGSLVKKGLGTLDLANEANAIAGGVSVVRGTLRCSAAQSFEGLSIFSGATLEICAQAGVPVAVTANVDVDLAGVNVKVNGADGSSWRTVFATTGGHVIRNLPNASTKLKWRVIPGSDGSLLQAKETQGLMLLFR